jgi:Fe2+ transport system protein FeoA
MADSLKSLDLLGCVQSGVVRDIQGGRGVGRRLSAMGLHPGATVRLVCAQPARGPVVVEINGTTRLALGRGIARKVMVEVKGT